MTDNNLSQNTHKVNNYFKSSSAQMSKNAQNSSKQANKKWKKMCVGAVREKRGAV